MCEPRIGDLVSVDGCHAEVERVDGDSPWPVTAKALGACRWWRMEPGTVAPLRPDAPGQRVRAFVGGVFSAGVTAEAVTDPLRDRRGFIVRWDAGGEGPWETGHLIRIADQAPAAPVEVEAPLAPPEFAPGSVRWTAGQTCQHCGSGVLAGLLADTCPRGCDLTLRAAEPEPDHVGTRLVPMRCGHEALWIARGRGAIGTPHPTREGAIAAWREAVRR